MPILLSLLFLLFLLFLPPILPMSLTQPLLPHPSFKYRSMSGAITASVFPLAVAETMIAFFPDRTTGMVRDWIGSNLPYLLKKVIHVRLSLRRSESIWKFSDWFIRMKTSGIKSSYQSLDESTGFRSRCFDRLVCSHLCVICLWYHKHYARGLAAVTAGYACDTRGNWECVKVEGRACGGRDVGGGRFWRR